MLRICVTELRGDHAQRDTAHRQYTCMGVPEDVERSGRVDTRAQGCLLDGALLLRGFPGVPVGTGEDHGGRLLSGAVV